MASNGGRPPTLEMRNVSKTFPGIKALSNVQLKAWGGEVLALMGENGAGKSTLMKILSGAYQADPGGEILIDELMKRLDAGLRAIAPEARQTPRILRGSFRADAGAIGAASLPMFFNFSPRADVLRGRSRPRHPETANA